MKRLLTSALAAALVVAGAAGSAAAQDDVMVDRRASLFDLGIYAGGAWTTDWFEIGDEGFAPGVSPIFGLTATYWLSPSFGIRAHGAYMPANLPEPDDDFFAEDENDNWLMNNWFYDLDLVYRPFFWSDGGFLSSLYLFLGGGGLTTNIAGDNFAYPGCIAIPAWVVNGVCLSDRPKQASVGQGVAGFGIDVFPITPSIGLFLEGAVHGYDSPAHVEEEAQNADDKFAFTPRLVLGLKFGFGNILPPPPEPVPPPPPVIAPPPPPVVAPPPPPPVQSISVCVIQGGQLTTVTAQYDPATGDTTVNGTPFATAFPTDASYAAGATWYINNEPITFNNRRYVKYGLPRVLGVTEVTRAGDVSGVGVYTEAGATGTPEVIYIPVRPGCEFQPYQLERKTGSVRG